MKCPKLDPVLSAIVTGELLLFISGSTIVWSSTEIEKLANPTLSPFDHHPSSEELSWISSILALGASVGPFIYGYLWNKIGRKRVVLALGFPFLAAYIILALVKSVSLFCVGRFLAGLSVGGTFATIPMYIGEVAPKLTTRRALMSTLYCAVCIGILLSSALGPGTTVLQFNCTLAAMSAVFLLLFLFLGVESPHYYFYQQNNEMARKSLEFLRIGYPIEYIDNELIEIELLVIEEKTSRIGDMFSCKAAVRATVMAISLAVFQQSSGISVVLFFCLTIFNITGVGLVSSVSAIIVGLAQFLCSIATPVVLELYGGKKILLCSAVGMIASELCFSIYCFLAEHQINVQSVSFIPVLAITVFVIFYNLGFGPVPLMMMEEIFPRKVKTMCVCTVWGLNWLLAFIITKYFHTAVLDSGIEVLFLVFTVCCITSVPFIHFFVIDTNGKTLEEIQDILSE